ncbi:MAG: lipocalin-like domain-containing protein [Woeseiaceae bacterium]
MAHLPLSACNDNARPANLPATGGSSRLSEVLGAGNTEGYAMALEPRTFSFPADHGQHPDYRNEWWYVTGNLDGAAGQRFGFELTIFRFALAPAVQQASAAERSAWISNQVFIGHFAVTDADAGRFHVAQRFARGGALRLAGAESAPPKVWLEDWSQEASAEGDGNGAWRLEAREPDVELSLSLSPLKAPVLNGIDGLSQKSSEAGNASYYYSIPRLQTAGTLRIGGDTHEVSGLAWLDREWGSSALSVQQEGWDWFALQLSDGSDLMYYRMRRSDGRPDRHSAGTWIPAQGEAVHLSHDDVRIDVRDHWDSPQGGRYPVAWTITIPRLELEVQVDPVLDAQELDTSVRYWEGAVDVDGVRSGGAIGGRGYVELTGYARDPTSAPAR